MKAKINCNFETCCLNLMKPVRVTDYMWERLHESVDTPRPSFNVMTAVALLKIKGIVPVLLYIAGYAMHATLKRLNCTKCRSVLTVSKTITVSPNQENYDLVKQCDCGGLVFPAMFAVNAVAHNYVAVERLSKHADFLRVPNQHKLVTELTVDLLANEDCWEFDARDDGHTWNSANILLKNICSRTNDKAVHDNKYKKSRNP